MTLAATALTLLLAAAPEVATGPADPVYPWAGSHSLIFGHVVERSGFHFQIMFGLGYTFF